MEHIRPGRLRTALRIQQPLQVAPDACLVVADGHGTRELRISGLALFKIDEPIEDRLGYVCFVVDFRHILYGSPATRKRSSTLAPGRVLQCDCITAPGTSAPRRVGSCTYKGEPRHWRPSRRSPNLPASARRSSPAIVRETGGQDWIGRGR